MNQTVVHFLGPRRIELREEGLDAPGDDQVLVRTRLSAISAGTEMLLFRGELSSGQHADVDPISSGLSYPTTYGYCAVGSVIEVGRAVDPSWRGRTVFGFQPHRSHFLARPDTLLAVPGDLTPEEAVFLPGAETAVNLVQDSAPILGERVLVLGQGVVGLLSAALLHEFPLRCLVTADRHRIRRQASLAIEVTDSLDPGEAEFSSRAREYAEGDPAGYDLTVELTGNPDALDGAIALTGFGGRVVLGSWFGSKKAVVDLGGSYHRSRISLVASQVSTIAPGLRGRWNKTRRFSTAWDAIRRIRPGRWITHRFPLARAAEAYRMLDEAPAAAIQVVLEYP